MDTDFYSVEQVASMLSMHTKTIQRYIREGKITARKYGKSWRISKQDLTAFTENNTFDDVSQTNAQLDITIVSSVVDIQISSDIQKEQIINNLNLALNCKSIRYDNSNMQIMYIEPERKLRITIWGNLEFTKEIINILSVITSIK